MENNDNPNQPLTLEEIWGVPPEELPEPTQKDYFDFIATEDTHKKQELDGL